MCCSCEVSFKFLAITSQFALLMVRFGELWFHHEIQIMTFLIYLINTQLTWTVVRFPFGEMFYCSICLLMLIRKFITNKQLLMSEWSLCIIRKKFDLTRWRKLVCFKGISTWRDWEENRRWSWEWVSLYIVQRFMQKNVCFLYKHEITTMVRWYKEVVF